jgi:putative copper export protein
MSLDGPAAVALLRGADVAGLMVLCGSLGFDAFALRWAAGPPRLRLALRRTEIVAAASALVCGAAWFLAEAALLGGADGLGQAIATVPAMLAYLGFARLLLARLVLLLLALLGLAMGPATASAGWRAAVGAVGGVALGVQPWLGHAAAAGGMRGHLLIAAELAHLFGAAVWLGGMPALLLLLRDPTMEAEAGQVLRRFSRLALAAVLAVAAGAAVLGWVLVGGVPRLSGTGYGRAVLLKAGLFATALTLAAANRFVLVPRLGGANAAAARHRLRATVGLEAGLGLAIVLGAAWLSGLPPGADQTATARDWAWVALGLVVLAGGASALWFARPVVPSSSPQSGVAHDVPPSS